MSIKDKGIYWKDETYQMVLRRIRRGIEDFERASVLAINLPQKLKGVALNAEIELLDSWGGCPILIWVKDKHHSVDYMCGLVAEIEMALGIEQESTLNTYADMGRVDYSTKYKGHTLMIFYFPEDGCHWVETGEEKIVKKKKLVCS